MVLVWWEFDIIKICYISILNALAKYRVLVGFGPTCAARTRLFELIAS